MNKRKIVLTFILTIVFLFVVVFIESEIISPLFLPEDPCYYPDREVPYFIELFYMNGASNGHPEGSFLLLFIELIISFLIAYLISSFVFRKKIRP